MAGNDNDDSDSLAGPCQLTPEEEAFVAEAEYRMREKATRYMFLVRKMHEALDFTPDELLELMDVHDEDPYSPRLYSLERLVEKKGGTLNITIFRNRKRFRIV